MPSSKFEVEPVFLSRKPLPPDKHVYEFEAMANHTFVGVIRQLSNLLQKSGKLFDDLQEECLHINLRTLRLQDRIKTCHDQAVKLDAKKTRVPVGDIDSFISVRHHFQSQRDLKGNLFTPDSRPLCIQEKYSQSNLTPVHVLRSLDKYRSQRSISRSISSSIRGGKNGRNINSYNRFTCEPVVTDVRRTRYTFLDIELQKPESMSSIPSQPPHVILEKARAPLFSKVVHLQEDTDERSDGVSSRNSSNNNNRRLTTRRKEYLDDDDVFDDAGRRSRSHEEEEDDEDDGFERTSRTTSKTGGETNKSTSGLSQENIYQLPSPEEQLTVLSQEFHPSIIPIDVSEKPFERMSSFRRSLIHSDFVIKRVKPERTRSTSREKCKRRNTICGLKGPKNNNHHIISSSSQEKKERRLSLGSSSVQKTDEAIQTDPLDLFLDDSSTDSKTDVEKKLNGRMNLHLQGADFFDRRSTSNVRRAGIQAKKESSLVTSCEDEECEETGNNDHHPLSTESKGTQMSNRRLHSLLTDRLTAATVKIRQYQPLPGVGMKSGHGDDGRSSSGNWSASCSSNHDSDTGVQNGHQASQVNQRNNVHYASVSVHHDPHRDFSRSSSNHSMDDKDSVLSDSIIAHADTDTQCEGSVNGYASDTSNLSSIHPFSQQSTPQTVVNRRKNNNSQNNSHPKVQYANRDSESWLQYFDQDSSESTVTPTTEGTTGVVSDTETLQETSSDTCTEEEVISERKSLHNQRRKHLSSSSSSATRPQRLQDDSLVSEGTADGTGEDEESVHSMDTDGYYTSMHTDSGLMRGKVLVMTPNNSFRNKPGNKRSSVASADNISLNSVLSRSDCETHSSKTTSASTSSSRPRRKSSGPPPPPPPRVITSLSSSSSRLLPSHEGSKKSSPSQDSFTSNSTRSISHSPSPGLCVSASESETSECRTRRKLKTTIDASKYPSMCVVTTSEGSDGSSDGEMGSHKFPASLFLPNNEKKSKRMMKMKDLFSMKPLDAISRTISKSRESIDEKIKRAFGSFTSSSPSPPKDHDNKNKKVPPPTKSKPRLPFKSNPCHPMFMNQDDFSTTTSNYVSSHFHGNHFLKRNTDRIYPSSLITSPLTPSSGISSLVNTPSSPSDDPFSRLFPIKHLSAKDLVSNNKPLKIDYLPTITSNEIMNTSQVSKNTSPEVKRPNTLDLKGGVKEFNASFSDKQEDKVDILAEKEFDLIRSLVERDENHSTPGSESMNIVTSDADDDSIDFLQQILDIGCLPEKKKLTTETEGTFLREQKDHLIRKIDLSASFSPGSSSSPIHNNNHDGMNTLRDEKQVKETPLTQEANGNNNTSMDETTKSLLRTCDDLLSMIQKSKGNNKKLALNLEVGNYSPPTLIRGGFMGGSMTRGRSLTPNSFAYPVTPISPSLNSSSCRRSWAGTPAEYLNVTPKRSPSPWEAIKVTSRDDFMKLLSQAKVTSPVGQRKSAVEILNASSSPKRSPVTPPSPLRSIVFQHLVQDKSNEVKPQAPVVVPATTPTSKTRVINGRMYRAPYTLQTMYPPIDESNEESLSKSREQVSSDSSLSIPRVEKNGSNSLEDLNDDSPSPTNVINGRNSTNTWV